MLNLLPLLAAVDPLEKSPIPNAQPSVLFGLGLRQILLIVGVAAVLGLSLFLLVYVTHKRRRSNRVNQGLSKAIYRAEKKDKNSPDDSASKGTRMRRRRRRRQDNLPRNPTLGETGGLPPIRPEEPPPELAQQ